MTTDNEALRSAERNRVVRAREAEEARLAEIARQERLAKEEQERIERSKTRQQTNNERLAEANREKKAQEAQELRVEASERSERAKGILEAAEKRNEEYIKKEREDLAKQIDTLPGGVNAAIRGYGYVHKSEGDRVQEKIKNGTPLTYNEFQKLFSGSGPTLFAHIHDPHSHIKVYAKEEDSYFDKVLEHAMILSLYSSAGGRGSVSTRQAASARIINPATNKPLSAGVYSGSRMAKIEPPVSSGPKTGANTGPGASGGFGPLETPARIPNYVSSAKYNQWQRELLTLKKVDSNTARTQVSILEYNLAQFKPVPANAPLQVQNSVKVPRYILPADLDKLRSELRSAQAKNDLSRVDELEEIIEYSQVKPEVKDGLLPLPKVKDNESEGNAIVGKAEPKASNKPNTGVSSSTFNKSTTGEDTDQFKPKATPKVDTETKTKPKPQPKTKPDIGDGTLPQPKRDNTPKAEPKNKPQLETIPQPKATPKVETKTEPKSETKTQPKNETKTQPKVEPKVEIKPEPKTEPVTDKKVDTKTVVDNGGGGGGGKSDDKKKNLPKFSLNDADLKKLAKENDGKYITKFQYQQGNVGKEVNLLTGRTRGLKRSEYKVIPGRTAQESLEATGFSDTKPKYFKFDIGKFIVDTSKGRLSYEVDNGQGGVLRTGNSRRKLVK